MTVSWDPDGRDAPQLSVVLSVRAEKPGIRGVLAAVGEIDLASVGSLRAAALDVVTVAGRLGGPVELVLDWERVSFLDSSAVHLLEHLVTTGAHDGWSVHLVPPSAAGPARLLRLAEDRRWLPPHLVDPLGHRAPGSRPFQPDPTDVSSR